LQTKYITEPLSLLVILVLITLSSSNCSGNEAGLNLTPVDSERLVEQAVGSNTEEKVESFEEDETSTSDLSQLSEERLYLEARYYSSLGLREKANIYFRELEGRDWALADHALFYFAENLFEMGEYEAAGEKYDQISSKHPASIFLKGSLLKSAICLFEEKRFQESVAKLNSVLLMDLDYADSAAARLYLARSYEEMGDFANAGMAYVSLWVNNPTTEEADQAKSGINEFTSLGKAEIEINFEQRIKRISILISRYYYSVALEELTILEEESKDADRDDIYREVRLQIARVLYNLGYYERAIEELKKNYGLFDEAAVREESIYYIAKSELKLGNRDEAIGWFEEEWRQFPDGSLAASSMYEAANAYLRDDEEDKAASIYEHLIEKYPNSDLVVDALWQVGWINFRSGDYEEALKYFSEMESRFPTSVLYERSAYWSARASQKLGDAESAKLYFNKLMMRSPLSYYGILAKRRAEEFGIKLDQIPKQPLLLQSNSQNGEAGLHLEKAVKLFELGLRTDGVSEFIKARSVKTDEKYFWYDAALIAYGEGLYDQAISVSKIYFKDAVAGLTEMQDPLFWNMAYPQGYMNAVTYEAKKNDLDPLIVYAIIKEESSYNPLAVSSAGAVGLMQIMPATGEFIAGKISLNNYNDSFLTDYRVNVKLGSWYLAYVLSKFDWNLVKALAAYNGGPGNVSKWEEKIGDLEDDEFIESIPLWETKEYVKKVLRSYWEYKRIYGNGN